ncbi:ABC transporter permease [Gracilinema caldarium]|uniref:ABC-type transporter, integral membrane subunit n=1 Tax=Gracilinema caldarium (strain ATCC 51460 / DSM 7334 / H1) TaxID=744872 RepID=F8F2Q8_GRAC1|nr:ABC transporter permease subunit [Gracilinema caldarium]AEJ19452.1 ABC-type transporter, integral membrane subunit [Gracilinema caldarium DSM 7334]
MNKREFFWGIGGVFVLLVLWELGSRVLASDILLPDPRKTLVTLVGLIGTQKFMKALGMSLVRILISMTIAIPVSLLIGIPSALNWRIRAFMRPFFLVIAATPVLSIILIAFIWFGQERTPIFSAFLMMFPILTSNIMAGIQSADPKLREVLDLYNLSELQRLRYLYIPSLLPYMIAGLHSALSLCWKVVVAAEVIVQPRFALGTGMQMAKAQLETIELIAWTIATVIMAGLTESVFLAIKKLFMYREGAL